MPTPLAEYPPRRSIAFRIPLLLALVALASCSAAYYATLEKFGIEKRDILVSRVKSAQTAENDAKEQFSSALDEYRSVVHVEPSNLERTYDRLNAAYEQSVSRADDVRKHIDGVQKVANDLFAEWDQELGEYSDPALRRRSQRLLRDTRAKYGQVMTAMQRAEKSMDPVLALFHDQVLTLKHDLNAQAIGALGSELDNIEQATSTLIRDMERAIAEANDFIKAMS
ncbi:MAG TPA: DUF2959 domain-containing protein [Gammaproteobacteria bacterium]|nr:DUF2959 domain-containing protein [Gammaproteobacteria bacterium]